MDKNKARGGQTDQLQQMAREIANLQVTNGDLEDKVEQLQAKLEEKPGMRFDNENIRVFDYSEENQKLKNKIMFLENCLEDIQIGVAEPMEWNGRQWHQIAEFKEYIMDLEHDLGNAIKKKHILEHELEDQIEANRRLDGVLDQNTKDHEETWQEVRQLRKVVEALRLEKIELKRENQEQKEKFDNYVKQKELFIDKRRLYA